MKAARFWLCIVAISCVSVGIGIGIGAAIWSKNSESDNKKDDPVSSIKACSDGSYNCITVRAPYGNVTGFISEFYDVGVFRALPYALPPTGSFRFRPTKLLERLEVEEFSALNYGPKCIDESLNVKSSHSEDCLHLNIYAPTEAIGSNWLLPVFVYIHGGQFEFGGNSGSWEQPEHLVNEQKIVVVSIQYRLGPFGFWYEGDHPNLALKDQELSFKWVQQNIKSFGGDPSMITIGGCSAGGQSTQIHLAMKSESQVFNRAIVWSAPAIPLKLKNHALRDYNRAANLLQCESSSHWNCLEGKTTQEIIDATYGNITRTMIPSLARGLISQLAEPFGPVIDETELTEDIYNSMRNADIKNGTSVLISFTGNEAETFGQVLFGSNEHEEGRNGVLLNNEELHKFTSGIFGGRRNNGNEHSKILLDAFEDKVPCENNSLSFDPECECYHIMEEICTAYYWSCNTRSYATQPNWIDKAPIYVNRFDLPYPANQPISGNSKYCHEKSCHCVNKHWFMGAFIRDTELDEQEQKAGFEYRTYLANFIKFGIPENLISNPIFESFQSSGKILHIQDNFEITTHFPESPLCDAFDEIDYYNQS